MQELTLREKIGQMFIVGIDGKINNDVKELIFKYKIGGFILYKKNYKDYNEMLNLINELNELNKVNPIPLFIAVDQEGGRVNRLPAEINNLPSPATLVQKGDLKIIQESTRVVNKFLKQSGVNMNLAPVLDIQRFKNNHAIGNRCYGKNKEEVCKYGITCMKTIQDEKVIPVVKHFPGHGATNTDSHFGLPIINKKIGSLEKEDMFVFEEAINEGADAIMVGHLLVPNVDVLHPASLSNIFIQEILRKKYRFKGLIMTDDLKMKGIRFIYGLEAAAIRAVKVGNDVIMMRYKYKKIIKILDKIEKEVNSRRISKVRINRSANRIINLKKKYIDEVIKYNGASLDEINNKISEINNFVKNT